MSPQFEPNEISADDARGLEEVDRVVYPLRKMFRKVGAKYQFQSPPFSRESVTLVGRENFPLTDITALLESIGFSGAPLRKTIPLVSSSHRMIEVVANIVRLDVHGVERMAVRVAYKLYE